MSAAHCAQRSFVENLILFDAACADGRSSCYMRCKGDLPLMASAALAGAALAGLTGHVLIEDVVRWLEETEGVAGAWPAGWRESRLALWACEMWVHRPEGHGAPDCWRVKDLDGGHVFVHESCEMLEIEPLTPDMLRSAAVLEVAMLLCHCSADRSCSTEELWAGLLVWCGESALAGVGLTTISELRSGLEGIFYIGGVLDRFYRAEDTLHML